MQSFCSCSSCLGNLINNYVRCISLASNIQSNVTVNAVIRNVLELVVWTETKLHHDHSMWENRSKMWSDIFRVEIFLQMNLIYNSFTSPNSIRGTLIYVNVKRLKLYKNEKILRFNGAYSVNFIRMHYILQLCSTYVCRRSSGYFHFSNVPMQKESSLWAVLYSYSACSTQEIWLHKQKSINVSPGIILAILP